jgi:hypothetical protein
MLTVDSYGREIYFIALREEKMIKMLYLRTKHPGECRGFKKTK